MSRHEAGWIFQWEGSAPDTRTVYFRHDGPVQDGRAHCVVMGDGAPFRSSPVCSCSSLELGVSERWVGALDSSSSGAAQAIYSKDK